MKARRAELFLNEYGQQLQLSLPPKLSDPPDYGINNDEITAYNLAREEWLEAQPEPTDSEIAEEILRFDGELVNFLHEDLNRKLEWFRTGCNMWERTIQVYDGVREALQGIKVKFAEQERAAAKDLVAVLQTHNIETQSQIRPQGDFRDHIKQIDMWCNRVERARMVIAHETWIKALVTLFKYEMGLPVIEKVGGVKRAPGMQSYSVKR